MQICATCAGSTTWMYLPFTSELRTPALKAKSSAGSVMMMGLVDDGRTIGSTSTFSTLKYLSEV